jgi:hypothetical protein
MAGRGLVTGGFLLCGWLVTGAGHAYAAQLTAQVAPHELVTVTGTGSLPAGPAVAPAGQPPVLERPALTSLALPSFPGEAGVSAGNHSPAGVAGALAPAGSPAPGTAGLAAPGAAGSAAPGAATSLSPGPAVSGVVRRAVAAAGRVVAGVAGPGVRTLAGQVSSVVTGTGAPVVTAVGRGISGALPVPRAAVSDPLPSITITRPAGQPRALTPAPAGAGRAAVRPVRLTRAAGRGPVRAAPADGRPGRRSARGHRARRHPAAPMRRQAPGATPQADTAGSGSAASGSAAAGAGGAGTGQPVAQVPSGAAGRAASGRLLRIMTSRWPAGSPRSDDPAVSPD